MAGAFVALILPGKSKLLKPAAEAVSTVYWFRRGSMAVLRPSVCVFETGDAEEETLAMFNLARSQERRVVVQPVVR